MTYVSHHAAEVERIPTRVVRIEAGKGAASGGLELLAGRDAGLFASARHFLSSERFFTHQYCVVDQIPDLFLSRA